MNKSFVNLKSNSVQLKMDMPIEQFKYFTNIIQNNILQEWIDQKKVDKIKDIFINFTSESIKKDYIIIISVSPAYNLSHKKNRYLSIKIDNIAIFIYQAKPSEFPRLGTIKTLDVQNTIQIQLISSKNLTDNDFIQLEKLKTSINGIIEQNQEDWDTQLVVQVKNRLNCYFTTGYWHVFCSKKISAIIEQKNNEKFLEFAFQKNNTQYKMIAFQKKGPEFNIREKIRLKIREIISFSVLLLFFVLLVGCKESSDITFWSKNGIKEGVCSKRSELLGFCAIILFGLVAQRMLQKYKDKAKKKVKQA